MDLNILWFILIGVLYVGFFVLEGFDFGVGILLPFLGKNDKERRMIINTIGPHWDGNEVWLLTAGGATFAAFPEWYATLFSGFYMALFLLLVALILRGVAFEFRSKDANPRWRLFWDWAIFVGSLLPALLMGVAFANLVRGVPIDADMNYIGGFWNLLSPFALASGVATVAVFTLYGAIFLSLKLGEPLQSRVKEWAQRLWLPSVVLIALFFIGVYLDTDALEKLGVNPGIVPITAGIGLLAVGPLLRRKMEGWAFILTALAIVNATATIFMILFPRVMVSSLNPDYSLTVYNASSSPYTLRVMTIVALTLVPIVLVYQGWTYWVFRKRITAESVLEY